MVIEIGIRRATPADARLLVALNEHVHAPHLRAEPTLYRVTDADDLYFWFASRLARSDVAVFLAEEALGFAMAVHVRTPGSALTLPRDFVLLDQIAVAPAERRHGVGRALMRAVEQHAAECGAHSVQLDVRAFNEEAIAFYRALGYMPTQHLYERKL